MESAMQSYHLPVKQKTSPTPTAKFDPTYGYDLDGLLKVKGPDEPKDFASRWQKWRSAALEMKPCPAIRDTGIDQKDWQVFDMEYMSTDDVRIRGWLLLPRKGPVRRGFIVGHGYGGRDEPDFHLPFPDAAILFPCARGISRSHSSHFSAVPSWHVLHNIQDPERYIFRGCAEDLWLGVTALLRLFPHLEGHLGYLGISFGGGVGALALAWEDRIARAHVNVPSFGHQVLRLKLPSQGSAASLQAFSRKHPGVAEKNLVYFDAAIAARHIEIPVHCALALADPMVAPPGQFAIYNSLAGPSSLFVLPAGHMEYADQEEIEGQLLEELESFFEEL
ncbi:MAG: acetylxylan esterase [Verrucomicrobiota bacterium]